MSQPTAADAVVHARYVLPMDPPGTVLERHSVVVRGGRVLGVLPTGDACSLYAAAESFDRTQHALLPGFVNALTHAAMSLLRGATGGQPLDEWLPKTIWPVESRLNDLLVAVHCVQASAAELDRLARAGSITVGKWADFACLDLRGPWIEPVHDVAAAVVHSGGRARVTDTWVAGRRLVADGRLTRLDVDALLADARSFVPRVGHCLASLEHA
jgi:cytosine/adenosine deaminase-related metal-dependent hydrolase